MRKLVDGFNRWVVGLRSSRMLGSLVRRYLTVVTYVGRRSGRTFSTPVGYRRKGDVVTIDVMLPDAKKWWRNFVGEGGELSLELDGVERVGHAVARRVGKSRAEVVVRLAAVPVDLG